MHYMYIADDGKRDDYAHQESRNIEFGSAIGTVMKLLYEIYIH